MSNVVQIQAADSITARTAGQVRAELGRARLSVRALVAQAGNSYAYWNRRVNGVTPLDVEDLATLSSILGLQPADFLPELEPANGRPGPDDGGRPRLGSNQRPSAYKAGVCSSRTADVIAFPVAPPVELERAA